MDKYAVVLDDEKAKQGSVKIYKHECCPDCGSVLDLSGSIPLCPNCGTKPFEKQPTNKE